MSNIWVFLNSQFFVAVITLLAAYVAWIVYKKQRSDKKRDIASSILSEIQLAEKAIERVKNYVRDTQQSDVSIKVLQLNSWMQYKHLFSSDFDEDEWNAINNFYTSASLLDQTLAQSNAVFESNAEQIRLNMQRVLADLVGAMVAQTNQDSFEQDLRQLNERAELFSDLYEKKKNDFAYTPVKYLNDVKRILEDINLLSTSTAGEKLKRIAGK